MNKRLVFLLLLLTIFVSLSANPFNLVRSSSEGVELSFELPSYQIEQMKDGYQLINAKGCEWTVEEGQPQLPVFTTVIAMPDMGSVTTNYLIQQEEMESGLQIKPFRADPSTALGEGSVYSLNNYYPKELVLTGQPAIMRGQRLVSVTFSPFQYNPVTGEVRVIKEADLQVAFNQQITGVNEVTSSRNRMNSMYKSMIESLVINPSNLNLRVEEDQPVLAYIVEDGAIDELQPLIDWKIQVGYEVVVAPTSVTGTGTNSVKSWIQSAYDNWVNPVDFVCLVGDTDVISASTGNGDHEYALLDGGDQIEDIAIGRLSYGNIAELQVLVNKQLLYERDTFLGGDWLDNMLLVGDTSPSGVSTISTNKYIKEVSTAYNPNYQYTELYGGSPSPANFDQALNSGVGFFNYRGYLGTSGWTGSNASGLLNGPKLPVVVIITCGTGSFAGGTSLTEDIIRAGTVQTPRGGVAAIGAATISTHTAFNNCVAGGIFEGLFVEDFRTLGQGLVRGKANLVFNYGSSNPGNAQFFSDIINLMGDPSLQVWKGQPQQIQVITPTSIPPHTEQFAVNVLGADNAPLEDAWVTATMGDFQYTTYTNINGDAFIELEDNTSGTILVTVTRPDAVPEQNSVSYGGTADGITVNDVSIDAGATALNAGSTQQVMFELTNIGSSDLNNVVFDVSGENITNTSGQYLNIAPFQSGFMSTPTFDIEVANISFPTEEIELFLEVNSDEGSWTYSIVLAVDSPINAVTNFTVDSNSLNYMFLGATEDVTVTLSNTGEVDLENFDINAVCEDGRIIVNTASQNIPMLAANGTVGVPLNLTVEMNIVSGSLLPMYFDITTADGYVEQVPFTVQVGQATAEDPLGPDAHGYYIYDEEDYLYNLAPYYDWQEINTLGTALPLNDDGPNADCVTTVDLPFNFTFYGEDYSRISVCSNGWIAMGESEQVTFRNWRIPGPNGPHAMIAGFWDDLRGGDIYTYFDSNDQTFIIEWDGCTNEYGGAEETFQIILYNPTTYPSETGDGSIKIQYKEFNNVNSQAGSSHGNYCSIGIMDHTGLVGLEYTYNDEWPTQAMPLYDQTALYITTQNPLLQDPPIVGVSITNLDYQASVSQIITDQFNITNTGEADLRYRISKTYLSRNPEDYYSWGTSEDIGGPTYNWVDISFTGFNINLTTDDQYSAILPLGFSFPYWDNSYNTVKVCGNGFLSFTSSNAAYENTELPDTAPPNNIIAPFWDDLSPQNGGTIYYYPDSSNNRFIVTYSEIPVYGSGAPLTFQVILYENGRIDFQYQNMAIGSETATVGIENFDGSEGIQIAYNEPFIQNDMIVSFNPNFNWISCDPVIGTVAQNMSETVNITVDTADMLFGDYACNIEIVSNDPTQPLIVIPVTLEVQSDLPPLPPELQVPISDISFDEDTFYGGLDLNDHFYDPNLDPLEFTYSGNEHINVIIADGEVGFMPEGNWYGSEEIIFFADDGQTRTVVTDTIMVTVNSVNDAPIPMTVLPEVDDMIVGYNDDIHFVFECHDPDSDVEYTWEVNNVVIAQGIDESTFDFNTGMGQVYRIEVTAADEISYVTRDWIVETDATGTHEMVAVAKSELFQNIPNPFNPTTKIKFALKDNGVVRVVIYDTRGRKVKTICNGMHTHGIHTYVWDGTDDNNRKLASGIYFYRVESKQYTKTKKAVMLK